jgi:hypothetical protein
MIICNVFIHQTQHKQLLMLTMRLNKVTDVGHQSSEHCASEKHIVQPTVQLTSIVKIHTLLSQPDVTLNEVVTQLRAAIT